MNSHLIELHDAELSLVAGGMMTQYEADLADWMSHGGFGVIEAKSGGKSGGSSGKQSVENMGLLGLLKKYGALETPKPNEMLKDIKDANPPGGKKKKP